MNVIIYPRALRGVVKAPGSKSETHRALICAALAEGTSRIDNAARCDDTAATARCLTAMGAKIEWQGDDARVTGPLRPTSVRLECGESGSTLRFLLPVALTVGGEYVFAGAGRLMKRPSEPLLRVLTEHGAAINVQGGEICASGKIDTGAYAVDGSVSSQYVSGLLLALPLLGEGASVAVEGKAASKPYIDMTVRAMKRFGAEPLPDGGVWRAGGYYQSGVASVPGDWSAGAFWLAAGAVGAGVRVENLPEASAQADAAAVRWLARMGASVEYAQGAARALPAPLSGGRFDASDCPDLVPAIAAAACHARGLTKIAGAARLRDKESDRLAALCAMIEGLGGIASETEDGISIRGIPLRGGDVDAQGDHRIAMAAAVAATKAMGPSRVLGADCVAKSYPAFFEDFIGLGGRVEWEG